MLGRGPRGARRGGWAGRGGAWAATLFFADFELLPGAPGRPGENNDWGGVCAPFWHLSPTARVPSPASTCARRGGPAVWGMEDWASAGGRKRVGVDRGRRDDHTVPFGRVLRAHVVCSVMGAHVRIAVIHSWRLAILLPLVETMSFPLRTHRARLGNAFWRARASALRCSQGDVVFLGARALMGAPADRACARARHHAASLANPREAARVRTRGGAGKGLGREGVRRAARLQGVRNGQKARRRLTSSELSLELKSRVGPCRILAPPTYPDKV